MDLVAGMNLAQARARQRAYLTERGYLERPDGWWVGKFDAAKPVTDEIDNGKFVAGDEIASDLMIRFVPLLSIPE
jgi:hypothetical protein